MEKSIWKERGWLMLKFAYTWYLWHLLTCAKRLASMVDQWYPSHWAFLATIQLFMCGLHSPLWTFFIITRASSWVTQRKLIPMLFFYTNSRYPQSTMMPTSTMHVRLSRRIQVGNPFFLVIDICRNIKRRGRDNMLLSHNNVRVCPSFPLLMT